MEQPPTFAQRLADERLGDEGPLDKFVSTRRAAGTSWRRISQQLDETADVDLSPEILRRWFGAPSAEMAS